MKLLNLSICECEASMLEWNVRYTSFPTVNMEYYKEVWNNRGIKYNILITLLIILLEPVLTWFALILDRRVEDWALMSSPLPTLLLCLTYILAVKVIGPALMKGRPAFNFKPILIIYNFFQIILSAWLCYEVSESILTLKR